MEQNKGHSESDADIINSVKALLMPKSKKVIDRCYQSVWHSSEDRHFDNSVCRLEDNEFDAEFPLVSVVILTANKIECDVLNYLAFRQKNSGLCKRKHAINIFNGINSASPDAYLFRMDSVYILHLHAAETGAFTPGGSADLVRFVCSQTRLCPNCIISFGICYGREPGWQKVGDVIIPRKLYPWSIGQKISEERFAIKHDDFNLCLEDLFKPDTLYSILRSFCNGEDGKTLSSDISLTCSDGRKGTKKITHRVTTRIYYGNMSTGEAVVSSRNAKRQIIQANRNERELGGEMEGYGLAKECAYHAKLPCFIVKSICDWGEHKNIASLLNAHGLPCPSNLKDKLQAYAAFCAGATLFALFNENKNYFLRLRLVNWLGKAEGKYLVTKVNYCKPENIIKSLEKYYGVPKETAKFMFEFFKKKGVFIHSASDERYCIGDDFA